MLVQFAGALPDGEVDRVTHSLGPLFESYAEGYGALRFRLPMPVRVSLAPTGVRRVIDIVPQTTSHANFEDEHRLQLL
jgi:hypothetical protein